MSRMDTLRAWFDEGFAGEGVSGPTRPRPPLTLFVAAAVWIVALVAFGLLMKAHEMPPEVPEGLSEGRYEFVLLEDARASEFGLSASAEVQAESECFRVQVLLSADELLLAQLKRGYLLAQERYVATLSFKPFPEESAERYAMQFLDARAHASGLSRAANQGVLGPLVELRLWALEFLDDMDGRGAALLRAVLTGERSLLEHDGLYDTMKTVGLAHMVAVSGSHLAVIASLLSAVLARTSLARKVQVVLLGVFYAAYAVFTGLSAPVIRSALMASIVVFSVWTGRRSSSLAALGVCVCMLLALQPQQAFSLSLYLSAGSTLGVIVLTPLFQSWMRAFTGGRWEAFCQACAMTAAASIPIFPVTASVFSRMSLVAPWANLVAAPVFTFLLAGGLICLGLCALVPAAGMEGLAVLAWCAEAFCRVCDVLAHVPYAAIPVSLSAWMSAVVAVVIFVALWLFWPAPSGRFLRVVAGLLTALILVLGALIPHIGGSQLIMLDVGQGDAFLLRSRGQTLLVDTGNQDQKLLAALARHGVASVDGVLVTHHDDDHCGSLPVLDSALAGEGRVYVFQETLTCSCKGCEELVLTTARTAGHDALVGVRRGDVLRVGNFTCAVLWPERFADEGGNADSVCLLVEYHADQESSPEFKVLLTGDAEAEQLEHIVQSCALLDVDILKAGHHGSRAGLNVELLQTLSPEVVLISAGLNNQYGHPAPETLELCHQAGAQVFRTDQQGDVTCSFRGERMEVVTQW